ncbi:MAG: tetratricopeptide repeat protein [Candidatus Aminicenantes bacterium]|nr:tetratricopeptide repeat protein [Candidatus Aminicenantes bacterium]
MSREAFKKTSLVILFLCLFGTYTLAQAGRGVGRSNGVVVDENKMPIQEAKVVMEFLKGGAKYETTTDKKGEWAFLGLGTGMWRVIASAEGYIPAFLDVDVKQLAKNPKVTLTLKKVTKAEAGIIHDEASLSIFELGNKLFSERKYDEALEAYLQFLDKNPAVYYVRLSIGNCYREKAEYEKALEEYKKVIELTKNDPGSGTEMESKVLAAMGELYLKKEDFEAAQSYFKQSIELIPDDETLAYNVGEIYFGNQEIDEAIHYYEMATRIKPQWSPPYLKIGYTYMNKGDFEKARFNLMKFLELDPESPEAPRVKSILEYLEKIKK